MTCLEFVIVLISAIFISKCKGIFDPIPGYNPGQTNFINPWNYQLGQEAFPPKAPEKSGNPVESKYCCLPSGCFNPCPIAFNQASVPIPFPLMPPMPLPSIPARAVYEPVHHRHPPIEDIERFLNNKRKRHWKKYFDDDEDF